MNRPAILCEQGHLRLAEGASGRGLLEQAREAAIRLGAGPGSHLGQAIEKLARAHEAFAAGRPLCRGDLIEDLPEGLGRRIEEHGPR